MLSDNAIPDEEEVAKREGANERYHFFIRREMAFVQPKFGDCGTQHGDCFSKILLLAATDEVKRHFGEPEAIQRPVSGEFPKDDEVFHPILFYYHPAIDAEVERADVLKCSSSDQLGALLETVDIFDREVAAKERHGDVTKFVGCLGTGS